MADPRLLQEYVNKKGCEINCLWPDMPPDLARIIVAYEIDPLTDLLTGFLRNSPRGQRIVHIHDDLSLMVEWLDDPSDDPLLLIDARCPANHRANCRGFYMSEFKGMMANAEQVAKMIADLGVTQSAGDQLAGQLITQFNEYARQCAPIIAV